MHTEPEESESGAGTIFDAFKTGFYHIGIHTGAENPGARTGADYQQPGRPSECACGVWVQHGGKRLGLI